MCFVTLPHCMQTSAKFWARVGFEIGRSVDAKEAKQATLPTLQQLRGSIDEWRPCEHRRGSTELATLV